MSSNTMYVIKRNGTKEKIQFDKVQQRLHKAAKGLDVNTILIAQRVLSRIYNGVHTSELDELSAQLAIGLITTHFDYGTLAARIAISNHQKNTEASFTAVMDKLANQIHPKTGEPVNYIRPELLAAAKTFQTEIDAHINHERDFLFDYFGFKTLERAYLLKDSKGKILERPQHLWMRVSLALWPTDLARALETYDLLSTKAFTHATPTLFNAGTPHQQLSSCFLIAMKEDSIRGIYDTLEDCALISKHAGGIGLHCSNIRAKGSLIKGTNGTSNGLMPMLKVFNSTARYVDQCFTPDTLIYTINGPKAIEDVNIGDQVLASDGNYANVKLPVRHEYKGEMLDIQLKNAVYPVRVTPEHQILALKGQTKGLNYDFIVNRLEKNLASVEFYDAKDLEEGDFLVFPIPTYSKDIEHLCDDDCRFYGILLGDGHISTKTSGVSLNNTSKKGVVEFVENYLTTRGIKYTIRPNESGEIGLRIVWTTSNPGFKFTKSQLYDALGNKQIDNNFLHLPINKIKQVLRGLIETDGCIGEKEIAIEVTSYSIIEGMRYMLLRLGALCSGYERNRIGNVSSYKGITTRQETAVLRIPRIPEILEMFPDAPASRCFTFMKHNNNLYSRIQSITHTEYDGIVHDFEINGLHDYTVAHLGVAHNGGGRRSGSFAIYLEPWHADVEDFLRLKLPTGTEEERARDLFYALWVPDLFMERVEAGADWTLFCPAEAPGLADAWGPEFKALYERYEAEGKGRKTVKAQDLWFQVLQAQIETGTPYLLYKDAANSKSNQQNLGTIKSSNLCTEIIEYSSPEETAVCNLASIGLPTFVNVPKHGGAGKFDYERLRTVVKVAIRNLDRVIDINYYPTPETERSNMRHRPVGLGVQGLADVFALMRVPWESEKAAEINQRIFENIYYAAVEASAELAETLGSYSTFAGSPASQGKLQPDLWITATGEPIKPITDADGSLDWSALRAKAVAGLRNSLLVAPMPTASTSQILGYNECFEPFTSNIYTRRTLAGEFIIVNKYLLKDLMKLQIWNEDLKQKIIAQNGSIQGLIEIPETIQALYKTGWEIKQKSIIDMAAARGAFICQSQSLNLFVSDPTFAKLSSMHFYGWKKGLKTGVYYLRTRAPIMAQKFTVDPDLQAAVVAAKAAKEAEEEGCVACSS